MQNTLHLNVTPFAAQGDKNCPALLAGVRTDFGQLEPTC